MTTINKTGAPKSVTNSAEAAGPSGPAPANQPALLPEPFTACPGDDLMTALTCLMLEARQEDRVNADKAREGAEQAQEAAFEKKLDAMEDLAKDTLMQGIVESVFEGAGAVAEGVSAGMTYSADVKAADARALEAEAKPLHEGSVAKQAMSVQAQRLEHAATIGRLQSGLVSAGGKMMSAGGKFAGAVAKSAQEEDRIDQTIAERDVDKAKGAVESASTESKRAQDDIHEVIQLLRAYMQSKTALDGANVLYRA